VAIVQKQNKQQAGVIAVKKAYDSIKSSIIEFRLMPGSRINEVELAAELGMSRAPVREALNRLVESGFVTFDPGKGFFCRRFTLADFSDLYEVRYDLETAAVRKACEKHSDPSVSELVQFWHGVASRQHSMSIDDLIASDEDFHLRIAHIAGNAERTKLLQNIYERIRFIRKIHIESEPRRTDFVSEHVRLALAISKGAVAEAQDIIALHLGANTRELSDDIREGLARIYAEDLQ